MRLPRLDEKVAFVTGAGKGIGLATAVRFAQAGATIVAGVVDLSSAQEIRDRTTHFKEQIDIIECDVTSTPSVAAAVSHIAQRYGRTDVLVNNAGVINPIGHIAGINPDVWTTCLAVNAGGAMRCTSAFLPMLIESGGTIVNVSSGAAYQPFEGWSAYCSSKAALVMLSRATALEYADKGIRVFSLGLSPTDTGMQELIRNANLNPVSQIPRERLNAPENAAAAIVWLAGPDSQHIRATEIDIRDALFSYLQAEG